MLDEKEIPHQWIEGKWEKEGRVYSREDKCSLCNCERSVIMFWARGDMQTAVVGYNRSKQMYPSEHKPLCWGAKQPS